ncbi:MAG: DUF1566 domain-containing protein [Pseudomonadota bacterium]
MRTRLLLAGILLATYSTLVPAALIDRGNGMIYDDVLGITWLQNASFGLGSVFDGGLNDTDGLMTWDSAVAWVETLSYGGFEDWRLPSMDLNQDLQIVNCTTATELACRDNELGHLFYHSLMGVYFDDFTGDQDLFMNIQNVHWSGTEFAGNLDTAWSFGFGLGVQSPAGKLGNYGAWAVHAGDVAAIPLPAGVWLFGSGLLVLLGLHCDGRKN